MSFLRCFSRKRSDSHDLDKGRESGESSCRRRKRKEKCNCTCPCSKCSLDPNNDSTDGKSFSKTLHISSRKSCKRHTSCCESHSSDGNPPSQYSSLPSPTASVDPTGTPFYMSTEENENLPGKTYMPVSKHDPFYNMSHPRRGKAIIFNFDRWDNTNIPHLGLTPRRGSEKDKKDLARTLSRMDFEVEEHDNVKHLQLWAVLERVRKEDHTDADCLVVVVMTHGEKNTVYMRDGTQIPINLIWENFEANKCPSLAGKPKIFIVQACRGKQYDSGTILHPTGPTDLNILDRSNDVTDSSTFSYVIPNAADVIVAFSCPLGHYSWRHPERGSWFIQAICEVFNRDGYNMNLQELFTTVAREVALNYQSNTMNVETHNKKQVTSTSSTLIRNVVFRPKLPNLNSSNRPPPLPLGQEIALSEETEISLTSLKVALEEGQELELIVEDESVVVVPLANGFHEETIMPDRETFGQTNGSVAV